MNSQTSITQVLRIAILLLILGWCFFIIKPFLVVLIWAIILAVAFFPVYGKWIHKIGVSKKFATVLFTLFVAMLLLIPSYFVLGSVFESTSLTVDLIQNNTLKIPFVIVAIGCIWLLSKIKTNWS